MSHSPYRERARALYRNSRTDPTVITDGRQADENFHMAGIDRSKVFGRTPQRSARFNGGGERERAEGEPSQTRGHDVEAQGQAPHEINPRSNMLHTEWELE